MPSRFTMLLCAGLALSASISLGGCKGRSADQASRREGMTRPPVGPPRLHAQYETVLVAIERPARAEERYGAMVITRADPSTGAMNMAEDQLVKLIWLPPEGRLPFVLFNKSEQAITLLWEHATYVDVLDRTHRVIHAGLQGWDPEASQLPSVVHGEDSLADFLAPVENAPRGRGAWTPSPLFPCTHGWYCDQQAALAHQGRTYHVLLPLQVGRETFRYDFTFQIKTVQIRRDQLNGSGNNPQIAP